MLTDWIHWLSSLHRDQLLLFLLGLLLTDVPRYALTKLSMCLWHWLRHQWHGLSGEPPPPVASSFTSARSRAAP